MSYNSEVLADSPVGFWKLDESSGNFLDQTSNHLDLSVTGSVTRAQATGLTNLGNGVSLSGSSQYASIADNALLDITGDVTYEMWIKITGGSGTTRAIVNKGGSSVGGYGAVLQTSNKIAFQNVWTGSTGITTTAAPSLNTLYHFVVTRSGNNFVTYFNGAQDNTATFALTVSDSNQAFGVGANFTSGTAGSFFPGLIASVAVYTTALSAARVLAHYNAAQASGNTYTKVGKGIIG